MVVVVDLVLVLCGVIIVFVVLFVGYNILFILIDQECYFDCWLFFVFGCEVLCCDGIIFMYYQIVVCVCLLLCLMVYMGQYIQYIGVFDNVGLFW